MTGNIWWWRGIHICLALLLPVVLSAMIGCKKAKAFKEDLGPEVDGESIDQALGKAVKGANFDRIHVGQFLSFASTRRLEAEETTINLGNRRIEVTAKQENEAKTQVTYNLRITRNDRLADGKFETVIAEEPLTLNMGSFSQGLSSKSGEVSASQVKQKDEDRPLRVTYHHLKEFSGEIDVPPAVKNRDGCGGLPSCKIPVNYIQFEMVLWSSETDYQKISLDFTFTTVTPYLPFGENFDQFTGLMISDCRSTYVPIETRTVYVRDCMSLDDFEL